MSEAQFIGGQAVIEGVMMRSQRRFAVAVRRSDGEIALHQEEIHPFLEHHRWLNKPLLRGLFGVVDAISLGIKALNFSANVHLESEQLKPLKPWTLASTLAFSFGLAMVLFILLPNLIASWLESILGNNLSLNLVDGLARMVIILGYIFGVSRLPRVKRIFEYHGAEHKVVHAYEAGEELSVSQAQQFEPFHPRCGTSLVGLVLIGKFLFLPFFGWGDFGERMLVRVAMLPVIVALSLEIIKAAGKYPNIRPLQWAVAPGMWLQRLTAANPTDEQVEVALQALKAVVGQSPFDSRG